MDTITNQTPEVVAEVPLASTAASVAPPPSSTLKRPRDDESSEQGNGGTTDKHHSNHIDEHAHGGSYNGDQPEEKRIKLDPSVTQQQADNTSSTTPQPQLAANNNARRAALLQRLKHTVKKTDHILETVSSTTPGTETSTLDSAASAQHATPSKKSSSRPRKSGEGSTKRSSTKSSSKRSSIAPSPGAPVEYAHPATPPSDHESESATGSKRPSRRARKGKYSLDDQYEQADNKQQKLSGAFRTCYEILQQIKKHPWAWPFASPVDVEGLGIPDYLIIIKRPMDLNTVQNNLTSGQYETVYDFADDVRLIWSNCMIYNQPGSDVVKMAQELQRIFEDKFKKVIDEAEPKSAEAAKRMAQMQVKLQEMQARIDSLSHVPANTQIDVDGVKFTPLPPGATAAQPAAVASGGAKSRSSTSRSSTGSSRSKKSGGGSSSSRKKSTGPAVTAAAAVVHTPHEHATPMSFDEKQALSELIGQLNNEQLTKVVEIIQTRETKGDYSTATESEIEIDLDQLDPATLRELESFAKRCLGIVMPAPTPPPKKPAPKKPSRPPAKRSSSGGQSKPRSSQGGKSTSEASSSATTVQHQDVHLPPQQSQPHAVDYEETDSDSDDSESSGDELDELDNDLAGAGKRAGPQSLSQAIA